jgi:hypothetical protein
MIILRILYINIIKYLDNLIINVFLLKVFKELPIDATDIIRKNATDISADLLNSSKIMLNLYEILLQIR